MRGLPQNLFCRVAHADAGERLSRGQRAACPPASRRRAHGRSDASPFALRCPF